jgi:FixJ family two-component response regulator
MTSGNPIYVAVVDDDDSLRRSYGRWLRAAGFLPVEYRSAEDFLGDRRRPGFECLILDIRLPGMSGIELRRRLAAVRDPTPVVYVTAHDEAAVHSEALAAGCAGYFLKTAPGSLVLEAILSATGHRTSGVAPDGPQDLTHS